MLRDTLRMFLLCLVLSACTGTIGSTPSVAMNVRPGYSQPLENVYVLVRVDQIPAAFATTFVSTLDQHLQARGVTTRVRAVSELDLQPVTDKDFYGFSHVMMIRPTHLESNQYALQSVTMNCSLSDVSTRALVMRADVRANKGWGYGFGRNEAENATAELIRQMEARGLLRAQQIPEATTSADSAQ